MESTFNKGRAGENYAACWLESRGITIIERNYRAIGGEIDLIGIEQDSVLFIEVKTWRAYSIDNLEFALNQKKRKRIIETAKLFLQNNRKYIGMAVRFDVLFIGTDAVKHIESAWTENL